MKNTTRKDIEQIAENWYNRAQKLGKIYSSPHTDPINKQKAFILMTKMSVRLNNIALALQQKPKPNMRIVKP